MWGLPREPSSCPCIAPRNLPLCIDLRRSFAPAGNAPSNLKLWPEICLAYLDARGGIPWWCGYLVCCRDAEGRRVPLAGFENARGKLTGHLHHYALSGLGRRPRQGADAGTRRWTPSHRTVLAAWSKRSGSTAAGPRRRRSTSMRRPADQLCRHAWGRISLLFRPAPADVQPC